MTEQRRMTIGECQNVYDRHGIDTMEHTAYTTELCMIIVELESVINECGMKIENGIPYMTKMHCQTTDRAIISKLQKSLDAIRAHLVNVQPHIAQGIEAGDRCAPFIDTHIDMALSIISTTSTDLQEV